MNKIINFDQPIFEEIQKSDATLIKLGAIAGNYTIITGCVLTNNNVSDGVVYLNGRFFNFKGGIKTETVIVVDISETITLPNTTNFTDHTQYVTFGTGSTSYLWSDFKSQGTDFGDITNKLNDIVSANTGTIINDNALQGHSNYRYGVFGASSSSFGVYGYSKFNSGILGYSDSGVGVYAYSNKGIGLKVFSKTGKNLAVFDSPDPPNFYNEPKASISNEGELTVHGFSLKSPVYKKWHNLNINNIKLGYHSEWETIYFGSTDNVGVIGYCNLMFGLDSFNENISGLSNIVIGNHSLKKNTTGNGNVIIGHYLQQEKNNSYNILIGTAQLDPFVKNKDGNLVIHASTSTTDEPLISGNFIDHWFKITGTVTANKFITSGGTADQYVKGDGSLTTLAPTVPTLQEVTEKGNTTNRELLINNVRLGYNNINQNLYFGNLNPKTTGSNNTALGLNSLISNDTGSDNTAIGLNSLLYNVRGTNNTAVGSYSLQVNTLGNDNTAVGLYSLQLNTTGNDNTAVGVNSLLLNTLGNYNTAVGQNSLQSNTIGNYNTAVGSYSLQTNTTGNYNVGLGQNANPLNPTNKNGNLAIHSSDSATPKEPLISGNFIDRWFKIAGKILLDIVRTPNSKNDTTFTKVLTAKEDGTIGWEDKTTAGIIDTTALHKTGDDTKTGKLTVDNIITKGGTDKQFVKGDGSLDNTNYLPTAGGTIINSFTSIYKQNYIYRDIPVYFNKNIGTVYDYEYNVILLHPVYNGSLIIYNECDGMITRRRGSTGAYLVNAHSRIKTSSGYNDNKYYLQNINDSYDDDNHNNYNMSRLCTCTYNGVKYVALERVWSSTHEIEFNGHIIGDENSLKVISYKSLNANNYSSITILNNEINNSLDFNLPYSNVVEYGSVIAKSFRPQPGTATTPPLIIPRGTLTTIPIEGAIERDENGYLYETNNGIRRKI